MVEGGDEGAGGGAREHGQDELAGAQVGGDLAPDLRQRLRLDGQDDHVRALDRLRVGRDDPDPVRLLEGGAALRPRVAGHDLGGRDEVAAEQADDHGLGHDAGSHGGDGAVGEGRHRGGGYHRGSSLPRRA